MSGKKIKTIAGHIKEVRPMEGHKLDGHEADIAELLKKGVTKGTIARIFGVTRPDLYYFMDKRQISFENKDKLALREEEITEMFNSCVSIREMAHFFHVSLPRMSNKIKEMGLTRNFSDVLHKCRKVKTSSERCNQIKELLDKGMKIGAIAKTLKMGYSTVYSIITKFGFVVKASKPLPSDVELIDKRETIVKMHNAGISTRLILPYGVEILLGLLVSAQGYKVQDPIHCRACQLFAKFCESACNFIWRRKECSNGKIVVKFCKIPIYKKKRGIA